jgi:superoxide reductase
MEISTCSICGHVVFGKIPDNCPVCFAPKDKIKQNSNIFKEAKEKSPEGSVKHTPVIFISKECKLIGGSCDDVNIKVGEVTHPMEEKHSIQFIDCYADDKFVSRIHLTPSVYAAGTVHLKAGVSKVTVVELCNLHGYWMAEAHI